MDLTMAETTAARLLEPLGRRWLHVRAVASRAIELGRALNDDDAECLVAAAWLHDVGYAPQIAVTGFHPIDGARFLRSEDWPDRVVNLVAHHSGARFEAATRGLSEALAEFPFEDPVSDALAAADLTSGPSGERVTYDERIDEILHRYPAGDPVHQTWLIAREPMRHAVQRAHS
ncbi:HD domain-containing protein [Nocardioides speluncae]|uniref:HD domain-containing protein n=1 Tax=Nocardioides speluncae TaxID=2670337 RepID=UPI0019805FFB|nr:HD domain-containing protein [Nocardioides speluncae]